MDKGEWDKGKESAPWISQCRACGPAPLDAVAVTLVVAASVPFAVLLIPAAAGIVEKRVIKLGATSPRSNE
jgi:hypothetical protein